MIRVLATREGCIGLHTATGHLIQRDSWFVALPSRKALGRIVRVGKGHQIGMPPLLYECLTAPVLDVGPWNTDDDAYVFGGALPMAERGQSISMKGTNGAGIDLSDLVFKSLGLKDNGYVWWEFLE